MKKFIWLLMIMHSIIRADNSVHENIDEPAILLSEEEIKVILQGIDRYVYFGPEICSIVHDFSFILHQIPSDENLLPYANMVYHDYIALGKLTAPQDLMRAALYEIADFLSTSPECIDLDQRALLAQSFDAYYAQLENGDVELIPTTVNDSSILRRRKNKSYLSVRTVRLATNFLTVNNNATIIGNLDVNGNETVMGDLTVRGALSATIEPDFESPLELISPAQQSCIIFEDNNRTEKARICSSPTLGDNGVFVSVDNGTTQNLRINNEGAVIIAAPTAGAALSVTGNNGASAITATGNGTDLAPALILIGNPASQPTDDFLTIDDDGIVRQSSLAASGFILNGCQPGPISVGTSDATQLILGTNGCNNHRLTIDSAGAVVIAAPTTGEALTVNGNIIVPSANDLGSQGILKLGGIGATNVSLYEFGTRNFFAGSGSVNADVTGADNISLGTTANSGLTTGNNTVAVGTAAQALAHDSISIGNSASATLAAARSVVIGSADSSSTGAAPTATNTNAIAIGSASGTNNGAVANGISAIAIGGADGANFSGASATGDRSIAVGISATASSNATIAIGSASGTVGGSAPLASNSGAIAIGSGHGSTTTRAGAIASGISAIAIGSADGTSAAVSNFAGAVASGDRSVAIGVNATASAAGAIAMGSASAASSVAATATGAGAIAIGGSSGSTVAASASGIAAVAIGGSMSTAAGASASGDRSVAIGNGASTAQADAIVLGNTAVSGVRVGIGIAAPIAKLDIVGVNLTPVIRLDQVNTAIGNAPVWLNPSISVSAGTAIHFNVSGQFFGFTSSKRYKTNIRDIGDESKIAYQLRPVIYDAKEGYGEGKDIPGFIAEEVYAIAPNLAVLNNDGQPENVAYNSLHAIAIKEIQEQQRLIEEQALVINQQAVVIDSLKETIQQLQQTVNVLITNAHA